MVPLPFAMGQKDHRDREIPEPLLSAINQRRLRPQKEHEKELVDCGICLGRGLFSRDHIIRRRRKNINCGEPPTKKIFFFLAARWRS